MPHRGSPEGRSEERSMKVTDNQQIPTLQDTKVEIQAQISLIQERGIPRNTLRKVFRRRKEWKLRTALSNSEMPSL
jgi:hypothetical protein